MNSANGLFDSCLSQRFGRRRVPRRESGRRYHLLRSREDVLRRSRLRDRSASGRSHWLLRGLRRRFLHRCRRDSGFLRGRFRNRRGDRQSRCVFAAGPQSGSRSVRFRRLPRRAWGYTCWSSYCTGSALRQRSFRAGPSALHGLEGGETSSLRSHFDRRDCWLFCRQFCRVPQCTR